MTPIELEIIRRKLSSINENLDLLCPLADMSYDEYDKLDDAVVFISMTKILTIYPRYVQTVAQYIQKNTEPGA